MFYAPKTATSVELFILLSSFCFVCVCLFKNAYLLVLSLKIFLDWNF